MNDFTKNTPREIDGSHVIRATFSLPRSCVEQLEKLRIKFARRGHILNRSELVRIGLAALDKIQQKEFQAALSGVERLKAGRPKLTARKK
jgi:hypothetical protein